MLKCQAAKRSIDWEALEMAYKQRDTCETGCRAKELCCSVPCVSSHGNVKGVSRARMLQQGTVECSWQVYLSSATSILVALG